MQTFSAFLAMNSPTLTRFSKSLFGDEFADFDEVLPANVFRIFGNEFADFDEVLRLLRPLLSVHFSGDPSLSRPSLNNSAAADTPSRQRVVECQ